MKHITNFILLVLNVLLLTMMACQKEPFAEPQTEATEQAHPGVSDENAVADRGIPIDLRSWSAYGICEEGRTCSNLLKVTTRKRNAVRITLTPDTHYAYNVKSGSKGLTYTFYKFPSPYNGPGLNPVIATFWCNKETVAFAGNNLTLPDGAHSFQISYQNAAFSAFYNFNCNFYGKLCF